MSPKIINTIINMLGILAIIIIFMFIWFVVWKIIERPLKTRDDILKERDKASNELLEIQAAKSIEWDKYKEVQDERDKIRNALIQEKKKNDDLVESNAKLTNHNDNLKALNKAVKKEEKTPKKA